MTAPAPAPNAPAPFKIGLTVKAGPDYGAEWLTPAVYGHTAIETAARGVELLAAMKEKGLIEHNARLAQYARDQYKGGANSTPKRFDERQGRGRAVQQRLHVRARPADVQGRR